MKYSSQVSQHISLAQLSVNGNAQSRTPICVVVVVIGVVYIVPRQEVVDWTLDLSAVEANSSTSRTIDSSRMSHFWYLLVYSETNSETFVACYTYKFMKNRAGQQQPISRPCHTPCLHSGRSEKCCL